MSRTWFEGELETVATFWRVIRRDGITYGFISHDRDMWFDGVLHQASPGMIPSAIRRSADFEPDSAEVEGALSHQSIAASDLALGRFDGAQVLIGLIDWESHERETLYRGAIGSLIEEEGRFIAELNSRKADLLRDPVPRTSPGCRAPFCGPGCNLSGTFFTHEARIASVDPAANAVAVDTDVEPDALVGGWLRWLDGPHAGMRMIIVSAGDSGLVLDTPLDAPVADATAVVVRQGCDHTLDTCSTRFANAVNFQGEPFLPGNDMLTRYPAPV